MWPINCGSSWPLSSRTPGSLELDMPSNTVPNHGRKRSALNSVNNLNNSHRDLSSLNYLLSNHSQNYVRSDSISTQNSHHSSLNSAAHGRCLLGWLENAQWFFGLIGPIQLIRLIISPPQITAAAAAQLAGLSPFDTSLNLNNQNMSNSNLSSLSCHNPTIAACASQAIAATHQVTTQLQLISFCDPLQSAVSVFILLICLFPFSSK